MDGLIVLIVIFGIISRISKNKKKQEAARRAQQRAEAFAEAAQAEKKTVKPVPEPVKKAAAPVAKPVQQEIPFTKEEWDKFLRNIENKAPAESKPVKPPVSAEGRGMRLKPSGEGISAPLKSTQGESEAEHRRHVEKIAAEEKKLQEKREDLQNLRNMNRQKLRQAVIMSEVLGKPVALRKR